MNQRAQRRWIAGLGALLVLVLAPLPYLGDLRHELHPYLLHITLATLALYAGIYVLNRAGAVPTRRSIMVVALLLRLAMIPMAPSLSDDAYRYMWDGRLLLHGISPYLHAPADTALAGFHDDLFRRQGYPTTNTIYPPAMQIVFACSMAVGQLAGSDMGGYIAYKLVVIAAEMAAIWLLLELLALRGASLLGALLYAWHPLVVVELAGQGHTDVFWVLSLGLALYGYGAGLAGDGVPGVAMGAAMRLYPLVLLPLWGRFVGWRRALAGMILSLPILLLFIAFFDPAAFGNYATVLVRFTNYYEFNGGFYYGVKWLLDQLHLKPSNVIAGSIGTGAQILLFIAVWLWPVRDRSGGALAWRALLLVSAQLFLGTKVHVWYFVAPLYLLPLASRHGLARAWMWAALAGPFTYLIYAASPPAEQYTVVAIEWGGFAAIALYDTIRERWKRTRSTPEYEMDRVA